MDSREAVSLPGEDLVETEDLHTTKILSQVAKTAANNYN